MAMMGEITHTTTYRYARPVSFGTHRAMFLPRRGASARLLGWSAGTDPPSKVHWISDARSNAVTVMEFTEPSRELTLTFQVRGVFFGIKGIESFPLEARPDEVPVQYSPDEWTELSGYLRPHADDPDGGVAALSGHVDRGCGPQDRRDARSLRRLSRTGTASQALRRAARPLGLRTSGTRTPVKRSARSEIGPFS